MTVSNRSQSAEAEDFREVLEQMGGFTGVRLESTPVPGHIVDFIREEEDDEEVSEADINVLPYWRVTTDQGSFGILLAGYPCLDVHGTGISPKELGEELEDVPEEAHLIAFDTEEAFLRRFKDILVLKQKE